jgi:hypothetical protein
MWNSLGKQGSNDLNMGYDGTSGPIFGLRLQLKSTPWRLGPAWAVFAGALASQAPIWGGNSLLRLGGSLLLADALWGVFWRMPLSARRAQPARQSRSVLPYADAKGPMVQALHAFGWHDTGDAEIGWQGALAGLALVAVLSVLLGSWAVVLSLLAVVSAFGLRFLVGRGRAPCFLMAVLGTGLPWALGSTLGLEGTGSPLSRPAVAGVTLGAVFTMLAWGLFRAEVPGSRRLALPIWVAQIGLLAVLAVFREAFGVAVMAGCFVVPCLLISRCPCRSHDFGAILRSSNPWWLASMLAAALVVRY